MTDEAIKENIDQDEVESQIYEVGFHTVPSVEEVNLPKEVDAIKSLIEKNGGFFISEEMPKKIALAYTIVKNIDGKIQKFDSAYFGWVKFEMKTDKILNVREEMDLNKNVLRYLIIKTVKESTLTPKDLFAKTEAPKKLLPVGRQAKPEKTKPVDVEKQVPVSEEDLDKTIEELVVD